MEVWEKRKIFPVPLSSSGLAAWFLGFVLSLGLRFQAGSQRAACNGAKRNASFVITLKTTVERICASCWKCVRVHKSRKVKTPFLGNRCSANRAEQQTARAFLQHGFGFLVLFLFSWCEVQSPWAAGWKTSSTPYAGKPLVPSVTSSAAGFASDWPQGPSLFCSSSETGPTERPHLKNFSCEMLKQGKYVSHCNDWLLLSLFFNTLLESSV